MSDFEEMRKRWREQGLEPTGELADAAKDAPDTLHGPERDVPIVTQDPKADIAAERAEESRHAYYAYENGIPDGKLEVLENRRLDAKDYSRGTWFLILGSITSTVLLFVVGTAVFPKLTGVVGIMSLIVGPSAMYGLWHSVDRHTRDFLRMLVPVFPVALISGLVLYGVFAPGPREEPPADPPVTENEAQLRWRTRVLPGLSPFAARMLYDGDRVYADLRRELATARGPELLLAFLELRERCNAKLRDAELGERDRQRLEACLSFAARMRPDIRAWAERYGKNLYGVVPEDPSLGALRGFMGTREVGPLVRGALAAPDAEWLVYLGALSEAAELQSATIERFLATTKSKDTTRRAWIQARLGLEGPEEKPCDVLQRAAATDALADLAQRCDPERSGPTPWWMR